jgi:hypothetical protein
MTPTDATDPWFGKISGAPISHDETAPGKNFSCNNATGKRRKADFYETPYSMTRHLLDREAVCGPVLEPACGNGAIVRELEAADLPVVSYDLERDFLSETTRYPFVITNPPYSKASDFIMRAKLVAQVGFCFLLPLAYLHGKDRLDNIFSDRGFPLARVHVFVRYPMLGEPLREDGKYNTGMMVYAWFVWLRGHLGPPQINWIDNDADVIRTGRRKVKAA